MLWKSNKIADRESEYHARARKDRGTALSPERTDFFGPSAVGAKRTHPQIMKDYEKRNQELDERRAL